MDLNRQFLRKAMSEIDLLIQRQIQRLQAATSEIEAADPGWPGLHMSSQQADVLLKRPFATPLPPLPDKVEKQFAQELKHARTELKAVINRAKGGEKQLRFLKLADQFDLTPFDQHVLLLAVAVGLDSKYGQLIGFLHDDLTQKRPSIGLALELFATELDPLSQLDRLQADAPLWVAQLLQPTEPVQVGLPSPIYDAFAIDPTVLTWLLHGEYEGTLPQIESVWIRMNADERGFLLSESMDTALVKAAESDALVQLVGEDALRRETAVSTIAVEAERPLLTLDVAAVMAADVTLETAVKRLLRDARLTDAIPCLVRFESCLKESQPPAAIVAQLMRFSGLTLVRSVVQWPLHLHERTKRVQTIRCPFPTYQERIEILTAYLTQTAPDATVSREAVAALAAQFQLSTGAACAGGAYRDGSCNATGSAFGYCTFVCSCPYACQPQVDDFGTQNCAPLRLE